MGQDTSPAGAGKNRLERRAGKMQQPMPRNWPFAASCPSHCGNSLQNGLPRSDRFSAVGPKVEAIPFSHSVERAAINTQDARRFAADSSPPESAHRPESVPGEARHNTYLDRSNPWPFLATGLPLLFSASPTPKGDGSRQGIPPEWLACGGEARSTTAGVTVHCDVTSTPKGGVPCPITL
jgi:hypothetical protein